MPLNQTFPTFAALNAANFSSEAGMADLRTGQPQWAGLVAGDYFDLTEQEAQDLSGGVCHAGRYRFVKVDAGATAANVKQGTIGLLATVAKGVNVVTSYDKGLAAGIRPVVFLNAITPGNFGFVQELGDATVLGAAAITKTTPAIGDIINTAATGVVDDPTSQSYVAATIGVALSLPAANTLFRVLLELPVVQG